MPWIRTIVCGAAAIGPSPVGCAPRGRPYCAAVTGSTCRRSSCRGRCSWPAGRARPSASRTGRPVAGAPSGSCRTGAGGGSSGSQARGSRTPRGVISLVPPRVVAPVEQRVAPARVRDVAAGALGEVPVDVADDLAHVALIVLGRLPAAEDLDEPASRGVADRFTAAVRPEADRLRFLGAKPRLELVGVEVDGLLELERDSLQILRAHHGRRL